MQGLFDYAHPDTQLWLYLAQAFSSVQLSQTFTAYKVCGNSAGGLPLIYPGTARYLNGTSFKMGYPSPGTGQG